MHQYMVQLLHVSIESQNEIFMFNIIQRTKISFGSNHKHQLYLRFRLLNNLNLRQNQTRDHSLIQQNTLRNIPTSQQTFSHLSSQISISTTSSSRPWTREDRLHPLRRKTDNLPVTVYYSAVSDGNVFSIDRSRSHPHVSAKWDEVSAGLNGAEREKPVRRMIYRTEERFLFP